MNELLAMVGMLGLGVSIVVNLVLIRCLKAQEAATDGPARGKPR